MSHKIEKDDRGRYGLCIFNAQDLTIEEIEEEFGKYGEIENTNKSNNLVFIHFKTYEEANSCCNAFKNHPTYRVNPAKKKSSGVLGSQGRDRGNYRSQGDDRSNQSFSSTEDRPRHTDRNSQQKTNDAFELPPEPEGQFVCKSPVNDSQKKNAKVVTIGNIPSSAVQQKDIYHLCSKVHVHPLHVDLKSFQPPRCGKLYYAFVHVKTDNDVENVVSGLNNLRLNGNQLIVKSLDKVLEEKAEAEKTKIK